MTKPPPIQDGTEKHVQSFSNTCMCYEGWDCSLERKFVGIITLLNCFIFSLELDFVFSGRDADKGSFGEEFMDVTAQKCHIAPD